MNVRLRILVVDDNRDTADTLGWLVSSCGHEVDVAYDGAKVLEKAAAFRPHVVLLDIGLPHINGYDLAAVLREKLPGVLIIAVTGRGDDEQRQKAMEAGFNFLLVKPIDPDILTEFLTRTPVAAGNEAGH
jgi:DNA-binding response OmpR family regulator